LRAVPKPLSQSVTQQGDQYPQRYAPDSPVCGGAKASQMRESAIAVQLIKQLARRHSEFTAWPSQSDLTYSHQRGRRRAAAAAIPQSLAKIPSLLAPCEAAFVFLTQSLSLATEKLCGAVACDCAPRRWNALHCVPALWRSKTIGGAAAGPRTGLKRAARGG
jgi:hypothetical protein